MSEPQTVIVIALHDIIGGIALAVGIVVGLVYLIWPRHRGPRR